MDKPPRWRCRRPHPRLTVPQTPKQHPASPRRGLKLAGSSWGGGCQGSGCSRAAAAASAKTGSKPGERSGPGAGDAAREHGAVRGVLALRMIPPLDVSEVAVGFFGSLFGFFRSRRF